MSHVETNALAVLLKDAEAKLAASEAEVATLRQHDEIGWNGLAKLYEIITGNTCDPAVGLGLATSAVSQLQTKVATLTQQLAYWTTCAHCGETMEVPGQCSTAIRELTGGWVDECVRHRERQDMAEAEVATLRSERDELEKVAQLFDSMADDVSLALGGAYMFGEGEVQQLAARLGRAFEFVSRVRKQRDEHMAAVATLRQVLTQIRRWDMLDATADGPYWKRELDKALAAVPAPAAPLCVCGHAQVAHEGHTTMVGHEPSTHCSQGCGCRAFQVPAPAAPPRPMLYFAQRQHPTDHGMVQVRAFTNEVERDALVSQWKTDDKHLHPYGWEREVDQDTIQDIAAPAAPQE